MTNRMPLLLTLVGAILATLATAGDAPAAAGGGLTAELTIHLVSAIPRVGKDGADLEIHPTCVAGTWEREVLGWAQFYDLENQHASWTARPKPNGFNAMDHEGTIVRSTIDGDAMRFDIAMTINPDPWVAGGTGTFAIDLKRTGDQLSGTFTGTCLGQPVKGSAIGSVRSGQWPAPVTGHVPLKPGDHPRMVFRAADVPALRERAKTPEGKAMLARLQAELAGPWSIWHASGHGLLYQLTGDQKHADEAKRNVEMARRGEKQQDNRYGYAAPNGKLRAGPSYAGIALAYDLCHDAWDPDYRRTLAKEIQDKVVNPSGGTDLLIRTGGGQHHVQSNHYMAWNGGGGAAIIGILGDAGTDDAVTARALRIFERRGRRSLEIAHGDGGYFLEGHHCGRLNNNTGFFEFIQASRVARGRDLLAGIDSAPWLATKMLYEVCRYGSNLESLQRGMYAGAFGRTGMSSGGDFAYGLGNCPDSHKPALLYFCNHLLDPPGTQRYDILSYPHRAVYAFANWPLGVTERNPAEILPHFLHDRRANYVIARNSWKGDEDVILSLRWGEGFAAGAGLVKTAFRSLAGRITTVQQSSDGRFITIDSTEQCCLIDFSGKSGALAVIVSAAKANAVATGDRDPAGAKPKPPPKPAKGDDEAEVVVVRSTDLPKRDPARLHSGGAVVNGRAMAVIMIKPGEAPKVEATGAGADQRLAVGMQSYQFDGAVIRPAP